MRRLVRAWHAWRAEAWLVRWEEAKLDFMLSCSLRARNRIRECEKRYREHLSKSLTKEDATWS